MIYSLITTSVGNKDITLENKSKNVAFLVYKTMGYIVGPRFLSTQVLIQGNNIFFRGEFHRQKTQHRIFPIVERVGIELEIKVLKTAKKREYLFRRMRFCINTREQQHSVLVIHRAYFLDWLSTQLLNRDSKEV